MRPLCGLPRLKRHYEASADIERLAVGAAFFVKLFEIGRNPQHPVFVVDFTRPVIPFGHAEKIGEKDQDVPAAAGKQGCEKSMYEIPGRGGAFG